MNSKNRLTHTNIILNTMCMVVGCNYKLLNMNEDNWYFTHMWTVETEKEFRSWLIDYLYRIPGAQRELYDRSHMNKSDCRRAADIFLLTYGWCNKQSDR